MEEKRGCVDPRSKVRYKKEGSEALGLDLWLSRPAWWVRGCAKVLRPSLG